MTTRTIFLAALLAIAALPCRAADVLGPYSASTNHSDDLTGVPDTVPGNWGTRGANVHTFTFHPPAGYVTRVLKVYGNFQGWMRTPPVQGKCSGVLWGLRGGPDGAPNDATPMDLASGNTFAYLQDATCGAPFRDPINFDTSVGGLLPDNILRSVVAVFLNDTAQSIHLEPSFTVVYQFERAGAQAR